MVQLTGSVTTVERVDVVVGKPELERGVLAEFSPAEAIRLARNAWLKSRGIPVGARLSQNSRGDYFFEEYEDNGSHYSGYYETRVQYKKGDEVVWQHFESLLELVK